MALFGLVMMTQAQFKYPQYNPNYYGQRYAILRQSHDQDISGSYAYR